MALLSSSKEPTQFSEIRAFLKAYPDATDEQVTHWTNEPTKRLCPICSAATMRRFESWNGGCLACLPTQEER